MIAIPDSAAGAMENWGLITYRETAMLYQPGVSSAGSKQRVAIVVSHELAHQYRVPDIISYAENHTPRYVQGTRLNLIRNDTYWVPDRIPFFKVRTGNRKGSHMYQTAGFNTPKISYANVPYMQSISYTKIAYANLQLGTR
ncbi:hypothetical protein DPMN_128934 [Dreissena polymorpha]|uniref:Peptidase M1 membrane alanine aminopeptidase domain-containing protein n=1 Tax=Dreissena polymorpha TaxID=45954 RepID=A0A9D4H4V3_DREPO|nr:hypothetical protein DPMN_128934 [Dreissena polymorpha]